MNLVTFDIDGTLRQNKEAYKPLVEEAKRVFIEGNSDIIILTGRLEKHREKTKQWLSENGVRYKWLIMREDNAQEEEEYKGAKMRELVGNYRYITAYENSPTIRLGFAAMGINTPSSFIL